MALWLECLGRHIVSKLVQPSAQTYTQPKVLVVTQALCVRAGILSIIVG